MVDEHIDRIARALAAGASRRRVFRGQSAGIAKSMLGVLGAGPAAADACRPLAERCTADDLCCSHRCRNGVCLPPQPPRASTPSRKVVVFLQGVCSSLETGTGTDCRIFRPLQALLKTGFGYASDGSDFLLYSYNGGAMVQEAGRWRWRHDAYDASVPVSQDFRTTSLSKLHDELLVPYREKYSEATFVLVGHSLGGVVAFQEMRFKVAAAGYQPGFLRQVITIDSPLQGVHPYVGIGGAVLRPCATQGRAMQILVTTHLQARQTTAWCAGPSTPRARWA